MENKQSPRQVKMTVELPYPLYQAITGFPAAERLPEITGRPRIPSAEIFRALVEELTDNPALRHRITSRIVEAGKDRP